MKMSFVKLAAVTSIVIAAGVGSTYVYYDMTRASAEDITAGYKSIEKERGYKYVKVHKKAKDSPDYKEAMSFLKIKDVPSTDPKGDVKQLKKSEDNYFNMYSDYSSKVIMGEVSGYTFERWSEEEIMKLNDFTEEEARRITPNRRRLTLLQYLAQDAKAKTGEVPDVLQSALNAAVNMYTSPKMEYSFEQEKFDMENQKAIYHAIDGAEKAYN